MSSAVYDKLRHVTTATITTMLLKKGIRRCWMDGPMPLAQRRLLAAVVASSAVGLVVDSIVFLWLAFGSLDFLLGQVVGKSWMVLLSIPFVAWLRRRDARVGLAPA